MRTTFTSRILPLAVAALLWAGLGPVAVDATVEAADASPTAHLGTAHGDIVSRPAPIVVETTDHDVPVDATEQDRLQAEADAKTPPADAEVPRGMAAVGSALIPAFDPDVPGDVRSVVVAALSQWDSALNLPQPVTVQVAWDCLGGTGYLGYAGPERFYSGGPLGSLWHPVALANQIGGGDYNGSEPEILMTLNAELSSGYCVLGTNSWHVSTSSAVPFGKVDLYTVVLHEMAHGLGFLGSAYQPLGGSPMVGEETPAGGRDYYAYDNLVSVGASHLLSQPDPDAHLTSNNLFIALGGGHRERIYAPSTFRNGSSFSHFDLSVGGGPGELMLPSVSNGQVRRTIDAPVLGVLAEQGWSVVAGAVTPRITSANGGNGIITVTWEHGLDQLGTPPSQYVVTASASGEASRSVTVSGTSTTATVRDLEPGTTYAISVSPRGRNGAGTAARTTAATSPVPAAPELVRSDGVGLARTVRWEPAASPTGGGTVTYTVQVRRVNTTSWTTLGSTTSTSLRTTPLTENVYQFRVRATNSYGSGAWSLSTLIGVSSDIVRPMALDGQVGRLYSAYLLRAPDSSGQAYWMKQRAQGRSLAEISAAFAGSDEFRARYGSLSDEAFVDLVYRNVVGRPPDLGGQSFWQSFLAQGNSRGSLMIGFSESPEYIGRTNTVPPTGSSGNRIHRLYLAFFKREPDTDGLTYWVNRLNAGTSLASIAEQFARSQEFQQRYGGLSNRDFVELIYGNVLIRRPDAPGLAHWTDQLAQGASRGSVMTGFSESPEFIVRTGTLP